MKYRRFLSSLLFGLGCMLTFTAMLAIVLPQFENHQLQLVLTSFEMNSTHAVVQAINHFVSFALRQSWELLYLGLFTAGMGAWLLVHFTPAHAKYTPPSKPIEKEEKTNPFARAVPYETPVPPVSTQNEEPLFNSYETEKQQSEPYFSPRLAWETQAIESEYGSFSQSGSRILIRSIPELSESVSEPAVSLEKAEPVSNVPSPEITEKSSRIRSTMGMHYAGKLDFPKRKP